MNDEQRREILPELDRLTREAEKIRNELHEMMAQHDLHKDPTLATPAMTARNLSYALQNAAETLRKDCAPVQDYVTSWYKALHWDMSDPLVEVDEKDLTDPVYESCTYDRVLTDSAWAAWIVIMRTKTHGRKKIVVYGDGIDFQIYSVEKM